MVVIIDHIINVLAHAGKGAIYSYDPVGSYQREFFKAAGSSAALLQPLLDNQVLSIFMHFMCMRVCLAV